MIRKILWLLATFLFAHVQLAAAQHPVKNARIGFLFFGSKDQPQPDALLVPGGAMMTLNSKRIVDLATNLRLPAMYQTGQFIEDGGLMAYGVNYGDLYRRAAIYVDKIIKGAKPADLPVELLMRFELLINLKAAKQIDVTIPPQVLARAGKVIR